jgi:hypothetical protein
MAQLFIGTDPEDYMGDQPLFVCLFVCFYFLFFFFFFLGGDQYIYFQNWGEGGETRAPPGPPLARL